MVLLRNKYVYVACAVVDPIETTQHDVALRFVTDRNCKTALGFQVKWYPFRPNIVPCTHEEFQCDADRYVQLILQFVSVVFRRATQTAMVIQRASDAVVNN